MDKQRANGFLVAITGISCLLVLWNTYDEMYILDSYPVIGTVVAAWLVPPCCTLILGLGSRDPTARRVCVIYSFVLMCLFSIYALNGSTRDQGEGAQHMHLVLVPAFLIIVTGALFGGLFLPGVLRASLDRAKAHKKCGGATHGKCGDAHGKCGDATHNKYE